MGHDQSKDFKALRLFMKKLMPIHLKTLMGKFQQKYEIPKYKQGKKKKN